MILSDHILALGDELVGEAYLGAEQVYTKNIMLFLSPGGDDVMGDGSKESPWATLTKAKAEVATRIADGLTTDVVVSLRGGEYRLDETVTFGLDDCHETHRISYVGYPGETAIINASKLVAGAWEDDLVDPSVKKISLAGQVDFRNLTVGGETAQRARWPKAGDFHVCETYPGDRANQTVEYFPWDQSEGIPDGSGGNPLIDAVNEKIEVVFYTEYIVHHHYFDSFDPAVDLGSGPFEAVRLEANAQESKALNRLTDYGRYYWENSLSFLRGIGEPGEWYFDHVNEILYYKPRAGEVLGTVEVEVSTTEEAFRLQGTSCDLPAMAGDYTFSCWTKSDPLDIPGDRLTVMYNAHDGDSDTSSELFIQPAADGRIWFRYGGASWISVDGGLIDNNWHNIVLSVSRSLSTIRAWIDGLEVSWTSVPTFPDFTPHSKPPRFGRSGGFTGMYKGELDTLIFLDRAIASQADVDELGDLARTYPTLSGDIAYKMLLGGNFDVECETIEATIYEEMQPDVADLVDGVYFSSRPEMVTGQGAGHDPTLRFNGDRDQLGSKDSFRDLRMPGKFFKNYRFKNLTIINTDRPEPHPAWGEIDSERMKFMPFAIATEYCSDIEVVNCDIHNCGGGGVEGAWTRNLTVTGCHIYNIGAEAVVTDGVRYVIAPRIWEGHTINNNLIHDVGRVTRNTAAIATWYCGNLAINDNHIYNAPWAGIKPFYQLAANFEKWENVEIARNRIRDIGQEVPDVGAIQTCGEVTNGRIHHNHIKDCPLAPALYLYRRVGQGEFPFVASRGIYMDLGSSLWEIDRNLIYRCDIASIHYNRAGPGVDVHNNILVDSINVSGLGAVYDMSNSNYKIGGDGTYYVYPRGNFFNRNVLFAGPESVNNTLKYRWPSANFENAVPGVEPLSSNSGAGYANPGMLPQPFNPGDNNCFWPPNKIVRTYSRDSNDEFKTLAEFRALYASDANSIEADPMFADYANDDFTVTNQGVLDLGFENFTVPSF